MDNYVILLTKVHNALYKYHSDNLIEGDFDQYVDALFNNNNRGIIYTTDKKDELVITIWSEKFSLLCVKATEEGCLKAFAIREINLGLYNRVLDVAEVYEGKWSFIPANLASYYIKKGSENKVFDNHIKNLEKKETIKEEFKTYEEYWKKQDSIRQIEEQLIQKQQYDFLNEYSKFKLDLDNNKIIFKVKAKKNYKSGQRIRFWDKKNFSKYYVVGSEDLSKITGIMCGQVTEFDEKNSILSIEILNSGLNSILISDKELSSGYIWVDYIGTKSILNRQKEALKRLFSSETANKNMKDFIPSIKNIILSEENFEEIAEESFTGNYKSLTLSQQKAVKGALSCSDIYLIQGPPGTGKTTVIGEIIQYIAKQNKTVLLSSQTNLAVDNVLQRIGDSENIRAIRVGDEDRIESGCEKYVLSRRVNHIQEEMINKLSVKDVEIQKLIKFLEDNKEKYIFYSELLKLYPKLIKIVQEFKDINIKVINIDKTIISSKNKYRSIGNKYNHLLEIYKDKESIFRELKNIQEKSNYKIEENVNNQKIYNTLYDYKQNKEVIKKYAYVIDALQALAHEKNDLDEFKKGSEAEEENIKREVSLLKSNLNFYEDLQNNVNGKLLKSKGDFNIELQRYKIKNLEKVLRENLLKQEKNKKQKEEVNSKIIKMKSTAYELKPKVELIIKEKIYLWNQLYCKESITKKELIDLSGKLHSFEKEFGDYISYVNLLEYLEEYQGYLKDKPAMDALLNEIKKYEEEKKYLDKILKEKEKETRVFYINKFTSEYLSAIKKSLLDIEEKDFDLPIAFNEDYDENKKQVELYEKTKDIREEWKDKMNFYQECFEDVYLNKSNLIGATCLGISASKNNYFLNKEFDYVIIDEAAKASSLEILIPLIRGKKIVLVGDHKQLSPFVERSIEEKLKDDKVISDEEMNNLYKKSLFGLMYDEAPENIKVILNTQFRMNKDISTFVSTIYYNGKLEDGSNIKNKDHTLKKYLPKGMYWVDTPNTQEYIEEKKYNSYYNKGEIDIIIKILKWIDNNLNREKTVGVISPYITQVNRIKDSCVNLKFKNLKVEINTIDAFQGREKNFIIMSLVRNNKEGKMGFISNDSRMNVAISRAQELLFIIGNKSFILENKSRARTIEKLVNYLDKKQSVKASEFFNL